MTLNHRLNRHEGGTKAGQLVLVINQFGGTGQGKIINLALVDGQRVERQPGETVPEFLRRVGADDATGARLFGKDGGAQK